MIYIITDIIIGKYNNIETVARINYVSLDELNEMILDSDLMNKFLTDNEYLEVIKIYHELLKKHEKNSNRIIVKSREEEKLEIATTLIYDILNSYYNVDNICTKENIKYETFREIVYDKDYIDLNFGEGTYDVVQKKLQENTNYCIHKPQKSIVVKSPEYLSIIAPGIEIIDEYEKKRLDIILMYIASYGDIEKIMEKFEIENELAVVSYLVDSRTKDLLNEKTYLELSPSIEAERILYSMDENVKISDRRKLKDMVIVSLKNNNEDIELTSRDLNLPLGVIRRILINGNIKNIDKCLGKRKTNENE